jgi:glycosyltransferase involved in cell wall biosynthesis
MNKRIRIFYEVFADEDNVNAQSLNARGIALHLDPERFESTFLVSGKADPRLIEKSHIRLVRLPPRMSSLFVKLYLLCAQHDILVYPNELFHTPLFSPLLNGRKRWVYPLEMPIDFVKEESPRTFRHLRRILKRSSCVVPITSYTAGVLKQETGIDVSTIIPLGIDTHFFSPVKRAPSPRVRILFVGRLIERKGPDKILDAARLFPEAMFRIVGSSYGKEDGIFADQLRQRVKEAQLNSVEFVGKVSQEELRQFFWDSDILFHPSRVEGIPRVTLEAGATGLPSIVLDAYQTPSVVDGVTGFQVKTEEGLFDRLRMLIVNRDLRLQMGVAAVAHVKQFDWGVLAKRWEEVFTELVA